MRNRIALAIFTLSAVLFAAPAAGAVTTVGSPLSGTANDAFACATTCTIVQSMVPVGYGPSPVDGVVVRWRVKTNIAGGPFGLRIAKPFTGDIRIGAGSSGLVMAPAPGVNEFATRLPIRIGDNIGLSITKATADSNVRYKTGIATPGAASLYFTPELPEGGSGTAPTINNGGAESYFNADVEPDADRDGFGDETQDRCPSIFGTDAGCDVTAPVPVIGFGEPQSVGSLKVGLSTNEPTNFELRATVSYKSRGRTKSVKSKLAKLTLTGTSPTTKLALKFSSKQKKTLRAVIKKGKKLKAKVSFTATDSSGNKATGSVKIRLKR